MKVLNLLAACAALLAVTTSCEHKELCYHHPHEGRVNVIFDWRYAPDANPETMSLYVYPKDGSQAERIDFNGRNGGTIEIMEGEYTFMCFNSDTHNITYHVSDNPKYGTETYNLFELITDDTSVLSPLESPGRADAPRADGTDDERVAEAPEAIWGDTQTDVVIESIKVVDEQTIIMYPRQLHCNYSVKVLNVNNIENVAQMSATISSMAGGVLVAQRTPNDEIVTVPFGMTADVADGIASGTLHTFGHCPEGTDHTHSVVIYTIMNDGLKYVYTVDVTDQVHNAPDPYNVEIVIDELPLPNSISAGADNGVTVETWETIVIELSMNKYSDYNK
jgi:hypothetical protein